MRNIPIGEVLKQCGYITEEKIQQALVEQKKYKDKRLGQVLIEMGFVTENQVLEALAKRLDYKLVNIDTLNVSTKAVAKIPRMVAEKYTILPIDERDGKLIVVMNDPLNFYAVEDVRQISGMPLEIVITTKASIRNAINYYYSELEAIENAKQAKAEAKLSDIPQIDLTDVNDDDATVVKMLNSMLNQGYASGASDIHIEPFETRTIVRMRIDGVILEYVTLPATLHQSLVARIKIMSGLDIAERRLPQDGHFRAKINSVEVNIRTSVIPTVYGEKAVLRYLTTNSAIDRAEHYGMDDNNFKRIERILKAPHGILYITGPTGSGKTTTLYMMLEKMTQKAVNISTIEDPVEKNIERINQVQVNPTAGLTFEAGLRSILRQDPDVIMVGETRDSETAEISVRAAITGHFVFSTLHTNDAVSSIVRLEDMGLPKYMVANSLVGVMAQRLVRKICPYCSTEYAPDDSERAIVGNGITALHKGKGCPYCKNTGYKGRIAIHEVLIVDREIRRMITNGEDMDKIMEYAVTRQGMKPLRHSALELVYGGVTTVEELLKVTYSVD